jgi:hypothetical protein
MEILTNTKQFGGMLVDLLYDSILLQQQNLAVQQPEITDWFCKLVL